MNHHWPYPALIAHRGAGKIAPENTLAAMRIGAQNGFRMMEYDVKLSRDAVPVLLHDDDLDRTSNGQGMASRLTLAELSALDFGAWHSSAYAGEPIPTLSSIAAFTLANQVHSNIEIKPTTGDEAETGRQVALAAQALWAQASLPPLLSSFSEAALEAAQHAVPTLPRALLIEEEVPADWPERLERLGCMGLNLNDRFVTQALLGRLLPPPSRRAIVVMDPSYEAKSDYQQVLNSVKNALKRFAQACIVVWYPIVQRPEVQALQRKLEQLDTPWLHVSLSVRAPAKNGLGLHGSGLFISNPPWTLLKALEQSMPWLTKTLAQDDKASFQLRHSGLQVAQHQIANTHALQTHNLQTDQFTHAANLAFLAFAQDKTQLVIVLPGHLGWQQGLTVQAQTKVQQFQTALAQLAGYTHQIFLVDDRVFANNLPRNTTILSQDQKAGGINIQTTSRSQTAQMRRVKALTTAATL
uniref:GP-PDE domain-containing protein n=1 Tax=Steinernema glaseri TaxID=37863 RepID=A0A1I7YBE7_9BILA